jgi:hypothetical protein
LVEGIVINKKLTKAERLVQEQMLAMLEWASDHPGWHKIGNIEATKHAAELLAKARRNRDLARDWFVPAQAVPRFKMTLSAVQFG